MNTSRRGSILIFAALLMTVLMGFTALAVDAGNLNYYRHRMQSAADAGAVAGAREVKRNSAISDANLRTFVLHDATNNGFTDGVDGIAITVNHGPVTGPFAGNSKYVEALITRAVPTYFMRVFGRNTMTVSVRAVAGQGAGGTGCIYALSADASGAFITSGSSDPIVVDGVTVSGINVPNCDILVNSSDNTAFTVGTGWDVNANSIEVVGQTNLADPSRIHPTPNEGADPIEDPFDGMTAPAAGTCQTRVVGGTTTTDFNVNTGTHTWNPGTYCGDFQVQGNAVVNFTAGTYLLTGSTGIVFKDNAIVTGTDVTFWITAAKPTNFTADASITLSAPTTGIYAGILIASTANKTSNSNVFNAAGMALNGVVYFPRQHIEWKGLGGGGTVLISDTIKFTGTSSFSSSLLGGGGALAIPGPVSKAE